MHRIYTHIYICRKRPEKNCHLSSSKHKQNTRKEQKHAHQKTTHIRSNKITHYAHEILWGNQTQMGRRNRPPKSTQNLKQKVSVKKAKSVSQESKKLSPKKTKNHSANDSFPKNDTFMTLYDAFFSKTVIRLFGFI